ncbi:MAG: T9SS type A sorting domain-containing protein [Bacteroidetes bacterium]|nr:T9SS type A sorting domain-containing protein [Bacteroidota bacterium]
MEGKVKIKVYNIAGREIKTVMEETKYPGHYKVDMDLNGMPSGVYFYRTEYVYEENNKTHSSIITKKAVLIK